MQSYTWVGSRQAGSWPGLASAVRYDELLQAAMIFLRIVFYGRTADDDAPAPAIVPAGHLRGMGRHTPDLRIRAVEPRTVQNNRRFSTRAPMRGSSPPYSYAPRLCVARYRFAERALRTGLAAAPAFGRPAVGRGALPARLGRGAHDGRSPPGVDEQGRADRRRRGCRGVRIPGVECQGSLPTRIPYASIARGVLGAGRTAPCGGRRRTVSKSCPSAEGRLIWKIDTRIMLRHPLCGAGIEFRRAHSAK